MIKNYKIWIGIGVIFIIYFVITILITSQDSKAQSSTWTVQTLKEYVDQRFDSMQEAVGKAEVATEKRFEGVNEFRNALSDQQRTFVPRSEYDANHNTLVNQVKEIKETLDKYENVKVGGNNTIAYLLAGISFLIAMMALGKNFISSIYKSNK